MTPQETLHDFYYNGLGWCGCGNPTGVMEFMRDVLRKIKHRSDENNGSNDTWKIRTEELDEMLGDKDRPMLALTYLYLLDALGLLEHGSNISGCWLSEKGEDFLALLEEGIEGFDEIKSLPSSQS